MSSTINEILETGLSLELIGVKNRALPKEGAIIVLDRLYEMQIPVLGGDVYEIANGVIQNNYDSWHCDKLLNESHSDFVSRTIGKAKEYIEDYNSDHPDKIFFAFVLGV